ncbi:helix-turn-helix domain-containing protein [Nocardioides sp. WV_118_6]
MTTLSPDLSTLLAQVGPVVVGGRVRAARADAALSLVELSRSTGLGVVLLDDVEHGRHLPDLDVLVRIAAATGTTADVLVTGLSGDLATDLGGELDLAGLGLTTHSPAAALTTADGVLDRLTAAGATAPHLERAARRLRATAREAAGDITGAIADLDHLTAVPVAELRWVQDLISLSRCHRNAGDLDRAIATGEDAEPTIRDLGLATTDEAFQLAITVAGAYVGRGDLGHATRICTRAAEEAEQLGLHLARASALWNRSIALHEDGFALAALTDALEALEYFAAHGDTRNLGRLRTQVASIRLALHPPDALGALEILALAREEIDWSTAGAVDPAGHRLMTAHALHLLGDDDRASAVLDESERARPADVPEMQAWQTALRGRICAARGDLPGARGHFQDAVALLYAIDSRSDIGQLWFELGDILVALDEPEQAIDAYRRASICRGIRGSS